jgi:hypothetical protein
MYESSMSKASAGSLESGIVDLGVTFRTESTPSQPLFIRLNRPDFLQLSECYPLQSCSSQFHERVFLTLRFSHSTSEKTVPFAVL